MNRTGWTVLAVALSVLSSALLTWRLQKYRKSETHEKNGGGIRGFIRYERSRLKVGLAAFFKWLLPIKKYQLVFLGIALVIFGQLAMRRTAPIEAWRPTLLAINEWIRIDVKYLGNVFIGMTATLIGGLLFALVSFKHPLIHTRGLTPLQKADPTKPQKSPLIKSLKGWVFGSLFFVLLLYRAFQGQLIYIDILFWVAALLLISSAFFRFDRNRGVSLGGKIPTAQLGILTGLLILALLIGTYQLQNIPNTLLGDEGNFFETARFITRGEYRGSIFGFGVYSYPVFSSFFQAGVMSIFGVDLWGWRFSSLLPSVLAIVPLYLIGRELFNSWVGTIASLAMMSSPYLLSFSRLGYNNSQTIFTTTLCVYFLIIALKKGSLFYTYLAGVVAGFGFLTYTAGRLGLIILCGMLGYFLLRNLRDKILRRFLLAAILVLIAGWAVIAVPHLVYGRNLSSYDLYHKMIEGLFIQADFAKGLFGEEALFQTHPPFTIEQFQLYYNPGIYGKVLLRGFLRTMLSFQFDEHHTNHFLTSSLSGPFAVFFYVLGFYIVLTHFWKPKAFLIFFWFGSAVILLSTISTYPPRPSHLVPIIPAVSLIIGVGVYSSVDQAAAFLKDKQIDWGFIKPFFLLSLCLVMMVAGIHEYFVTSPREYRPNLEAIMNWAGLNNPEEVDFFYIYTQENWREWKPFLYRFDLTNPEFQSYAYDDVLGNSVSWPVDEDFSVFIEEDLADTIVPILLDQIKQGKLVTFLSKEKQPIARAVYRGKISFSSYQPLRSGLANLFTSRVMWLIWPLVGFGIYLVYQMLPKKQLASLQEALQVPRLSLGKARKSRAGSSTTSQTPQHHQYEVGFFSKWVFRNRDHRIEIKFVVNHHHDLKSGPHNRQNDPDLPRDS